VFFLGLVVNWLGLIGLGAAEVSYGRREEWRCLLRVRARSEGFLGNGVEERGVSLVTVSRDEGFPW
jgi:hypothetical protein